MSKSESSSSAGAGALGCLGPFIAGFLSYATWGWSWWMLLHVFGGWLYVAYWVVFYSGWITGGAK